MTSREKFLEAATELFSKYGYSGVSVRDIAKELGMRESAMYKHFSNKSDILDKIILKAKEKLLYFQNNFEADPDSVKNTLCKYQEQIFDLYIFDVFLNRFRKIMIISQYENDESKSRYQEMFMNKSLRYYEKVFNDFMTTKNIKANPKLLAYELFAPLFMILQQNDSETDLKRIGEAKSFLNEHIGAFFARYNFLEATENEG